MKSTIPSSLLVEHPDLILARVEHSNERFVVTHKERPVAALVPLQLLEFVEQLFDRADLEYVQNELEKFRDEGSGEPL